MRSRQRVRWHRRAEPNGDERRGGGPRRGVHRGHRRPRIRRRCPGHARCQAEPACDRGQRAVAAAVRRQADRRGTPGAAAGPRGGPDRRMARGDHRRPVASAVAGPGVRLDSVRSRQQQCHRLCQGPPGVRHRRRTAEPAGLGAYRRRSGRRPRRGRGMRQRCVLPVPRRSRCRGRRQASRV